MEKAIEPGEDCDSEREALCQNIIEGCREMWDVYLDMAREWEPLDIEADRILDE